jgi:hypothetical protein
MFNKSSYIGNTDRVQLIAGPQGPRGLAGIGSDNVVVVNSISDLPSADESGIITLAPNKTYLFTTHIDLNGSRLVTSGVCNIFGNSSETSSITSTGLNSVTPLITSYYTCVLEKITFRDVGYGVSMDGTQRSIALDWENVNFLNVDHIGIINTCDNFIFDNGAFLNSSGLQFDGIIGTVGFSNSIFRGRASNTYDYDIIMVLSNAVITRRFRIIFSSFVNHADSNEYSINVSTDATIPDESYILCSVNFAGPNTLRGITYTDNRALFTQCVGIINTTALGNMYMTGNTIATPISSTSAYYDISGTTISNSINQKFIHIPAHNSLQYTSDIRRIFRVQIAFSLTAGNNNVIRCFIGHKENGNPINPSTDFIPESERRVTASGSRPDAGVIQSLIELGNDDEIYMVVRNSSSTDNITVTEMNMIIERTN